ncbi:glycosyltransferase 87 family protein [Saccharothrix syringae]|uniref:glycosyltransferase 87 family protein n=1 Tax=Saccharothrix syringae TaxID=103733 RepID=UPI0009FEB0C8|nr:glycosyltransferase 87 family protein [Saccharothrix syringae]
MTPLGTRTLLPVVPVVIGLVGWVVDAPLGIDSAVYRSGGLAVLRGEPLYDGLTTLPPWTPELPFTYPPVAALLFTPLGVLPVQLCWVVFAVLSAVALGAVVELSFPARWLLPAVPVLEPVWRTVALGQVNLVLMGVVLVDLLLLRGSRWSGVLVGVAAAVKLTPLIFIGHLVLTGRWRDAGRAAGTFAALQAVAFAALPADSVRYWTSALVDGNDATGNSWVGNQSLFGAVHRLLPPGPAAPVVSVAAGAVVLACGAVLVARRDDLHAAVLTGLCGALVCPVSWSHHWVWVVPLLGVLLTRASGAAGWAAVLVLCLVFAGWVVVVPTEGRVAPWALWGNAYVWAGLGVLVAHLLRRGGVGVRRGAPDLVRSGAPVAAGGLSERPLPGWWPAVRRRAGWGVRCGRGRSGG